MSKPAILRRWGMYRGGMLDEIGISDVEERVYRTLLARPGALCMEVARANGLSQKKAADALTVLESKGLTSRTPSRPARHFPARPDLAFEVLIREREECLGRVRLLGAELVREFQAGEERTSAQLLEVIENRDAIRQRWLQLQRGADREIMALSIPPYVTTGRYCDEVELEHLEHGITYRVIYDRQVLTEPSHLEWIREAASAGEDARVHADLPMKLFIADRRFALMPLTSAHPGVDTALLVSECALLDALILVFESFWDRAEPATAGSTGQPAGSGRLDPEDEKILLMVASGITDDAIARTLGVSPRTVRRRIARLMRLLGAETRFQAGLQAAKRGWV